GLFDDLVGGKQKLRRNGQAERLGGFNVDHQIVLRRQLEGQIAGLLAAQDAINIGGGAAVHLNAIRTVRKPVLRSSRRHARNRSPAAGAAPSSRWSAP